MSDPDPVNSDQEGVDANNDILVKHILCRHAESKNGETNADKCLELFWVAALKDPDYQTFKTFILECKTSSDLKKLNKDHVVRSFMKIWDRLFVSENLVILDSSKDYCSK